MYCTVSLTSWLIGREPYQATPTMMKSTVVDNNSGKSVASNIRTSSGTFLTRNQDQVIKGLEEKIAEASQIPIGTALA